MRTRALWLSVLAVIVSFAGGFLLANALNRTELTTLRGENDRLKNQPGEAKPGDPKLEVSDEEIRKIIADADAKPADFVYQKERGIGIYRYAAMKQDTTLLAESSRILARANQLNPKDHDVTVRLAHSYFDTGYFGKDNKAFEKARETYAKALVLKPADADVQTEIAMTYFLLAPPDYGRAISEFEKTLKIDPKYEKALVFLTQSYIKTGKIAEAQNTLARLREANPGSSSISELASLILQGAQPK